MAERHAHTADASEPLGSEQVPHATEIDREVNLRGVVYTAVGLVIVGILVHFAMWWLFAGVRKAELARERPLSPLPEARQRVLPPEPRLQADPSLDMQEFRQVEERLLSRPEWIDRGRGTARIPVDVAMDYIVHHGLDAAAAATVSSGLPEAGAAPSAAGTPRPPGSQP